MRSRAEAGQLAALRGDLGGPEREDLARAIEEARRRREIPARRWREAVAAHEAQARETIHRRTAAIVRAWSRVSAKPEAVLGAVLERALVRAFQGGWEPPAALAAPAPGGPPEPSAAGGLVSLLEALPAGALSAAAEDEGLTRSAWERARASLRSAAERTASADARRGVLDACRLLLKAWVEAGKPEERQAYLDLCREDVERVLQLGSGPLGSSPSDAAPAERVAEEVRKRQEGRAAANVAWRCLTLRWGRATESVVRDQIESEVAAARAARLLPEERYRGWLAAAGKAVIGDPRLLEERPDIAQLLREHFARAAALDGSGTRVTDYAWLLRADSRDVREALDAADRAREERLRRR
ncbi:MAG: hypothetical protein L0216_08485 [Planctomycetales bacterium]|nr:hypothetical protein [Planctomycetales bacterium]